MSGYDDVVDRNGALVPPLTKIPPNPYGVIEEMYGMIWYLAKWLTEGDDGWRDDVPPETLKVIVEHARKHAAEGREIAPKRILVLKKEGTSDE